MKLTLLIVNHNTCQYLKQALSSLTKAGESIDYEVIVVDNASTDGSVEMIREEFPGVHLLVNKKNKGLSKANNQAIRIARGEYILLIKPDTIINRDTFQKITHFMDTHPIAGGLNVRMISAKGDFLPESKRSLTKPWVQFFKVTGLSKYFPKSRLFARKDADWTEEFDTSEIDVLNGSCMLLRKSILNETGVFDERFFMYGGDIDFSYRIRLAGYKNYYFSKTYIIHLKGQDINKFSWSYIKNFYGAMFIFAGKYLFKMPVLNVKSVGQLYPPLYEME